MARTLASKPLPQPNQMLASLAALQTQVELLTLQVTKNTERIEGNGRPGLLSDVDKLQVGEVEACSEFTTIKQRLSEVADSQVKTQALLGELTVLVRRHIEPGNLDHDTLAKLWSTRPGTLLKWMGVAIVAFTLLEQSGMLARLGALLAGLHP